jgi:hypothetical protein
MPDVAAKPAIILHQAEATAMFRSARERKLILGLLLVVVTLALYNPVSRNGFVNFDDDRYVTDNPPVRAGIRWSTISEHSPEHRRLEPRRRLLRTIRRRQSQRRRISSPRPRPPSGRPSRRCQPRLPAGPPIIERYQPVPAAGSPVGRSIERDRTPPHSALFFRDLGRMLAN